MHDPAKIITDLALTLHTRRDCLRRACGAGVVAWLGFEGSFHFSKLLTPDIANLVYGVCASGSPVELALEAEERAGG